MIEQQVNDVPVRPNNETEWLNNPLEFFIILDNSTYERVYTRGLHQFTPLVHQTEHNRIIFLSLLCFIA